MSAQEGSNLNEVRSTPVTQDERPSLWSMDVRKVVYSALGIALYAILNIIFNIIPLPNAAGGAVSLRPGIVIPLFFGSLFGPVVGLLVGGVGNIISDLVTYHNIYWNWEIGNALFGLIAGLLVAFTLGRYRTNRAIILAEIVGVIAVIIGTGFGGYTDIWVSKYSFGAASSEFLVAAISDIINAIILLPILIVAYNAAVRRRGRA